MDETLLYQQLISSSDQDIDTLFYHPSQSENTVRALFEKLFSNGNLGNTLWLCPSHRLGRLRTAQLASFLSEKGISVFRMPNYVTINDFAVENARYVFRGKKRLTQLNQEAFIRNAVIDARLNNNFLGVSDSWLAGIEAMTKASMNFIREVKAHLEIGPQEVARMLDESLKELEKSDYPRLDVGRWERIKIRAYFPTRVFKIYEDALSKGGYFDPDDALKAPVFEKAIRDNVVVDSFLDLDPHELKFLSGILRSASKSYLLVPRFKMGKYLPAGNMEEQFLPNYVQKLARDCPEAAPIETDVRFYSVDCFETPSLESEEIALRVDALIRAGMPPERITIVFPDLEEHATAISEKLKNLNIPFNLSIGKELVKLPLGKLFLQAIDVAIFDFDLNAFLKLFFNPEIACLSLKEKTALYEVMCEDEMYFGELTIASVARRTLKNESANKILKIIELIKVLPEKTSFREVADVLYEIGIVAGAISFNGRNPPEKQEEIDKVVEALKFCSEAQSKGLEEWFKKSKDEKAHGLLRYISLMFSSALSQQTMPQIGDVAEGVQVTGILETRGASCEILFLGGCIDGKLPGSPSKDIFLTEKLRSKIGLPGVKDFFSMRRADFWRVLNSARQGVFISWHRKSGRLENVISRFVEELASFTKSPGTVLAPTGLKPFDWKSHVERSKRRTLKRVDTYSVEEEPLSPAGKKEISVTDIVEYLVCPMKYKLKQINGVRILKEPDELISSAMFGRLVHSAIFDFVDEHLSTEKLRDEFIELSEEAKKYTFSELNKRFIKHFGELLKKRDYELEAAAKLLDKVEARKNKIFENASGYILKSAKDCMRITTENSEENRIYADIGSAIIRGSIDWVEYVDGGPSGRKHLTLKDFKIKEAPKNVEARDRDQLLIYKLIYKIANPQTEVTSSYVVYVNERECVAKVPPKRREGLELTEVVDRIINGHFEPVLSKCRYCSFSQYCLEAKR